MKNTLKNNFNYTLKQALTTSPVILLVDSPVKTNSVILNQKELIMESLNRIGKASTPMVSVKQIAFSFTFNQSCHLAGRFTSKPFL